MQRLSAAAYLGRWTAQVIGKGTFKVYQVAVEQNFATRQEH